MPRLLLSMGAWAIVLDPRHLVHVLAVVTSAAVNIGVHVSFLFVSSFFGLVLNIPYINEFILYLSFSDLSYLA